MATTYRTKAGETLDWICWEYYVKEVSLGSAALSIDPSLMGNSSLMENGFLLNSQSDDNIRGAVEKVLIANPGLANYPLDLPSGLEIQLPDFTQELATNDSVKLWD
jgi:phage tail protein X